MGSHKISSSFWFHTLFMTRCRYFLLTCVFIWILYIIISKEIGSLGKGKAQNARESALEYKPNHNLCKPNIPCQYSDTVRLRIIVMVFNRDDSLKKCLESLQDLDLDGDTGTVEIWIDRSKKGEVDNKTLKVAQEFEWKQGTVQVHVQKKHVGIYGQWIDTWRPKIGSDELALFLEDDVDVSRYAYKWIRAVHKNYKDRSDVAGYSLFEGESPGMKDKLPTGYAAIMQKRLGSNGFVPHPERWREFQDWFHETKKDPNFHPYVPQDPLITGWYKSFEKQHRQDSMWTIWHIYWTEQHELYTIYPNIGTYMNGKYSSFRKEQYLAYHRRENGLHFSGKGRISQQKLIQHWENDFISFPNVLPQFFYNGQMMNNAEP